MNEKLRDLLFLPYRTNQEVVHCISTMMIEHFYQQMDESVQTLQEELNT